MAHKWSEIEARMGSERVAASRARALKMADEMPLNQLRNAREMTQTRLAELLDMDQPNISKLERRTDMYLSTLRSYIEAMGGKLEIRAVFPDGEVKVELLNKLSV